jgi:hypothetical protein
MRKFYLICAVIIILPLFSGYIYDDYKFRKISIKKYYSPCEGDSNECTYFILHYDEFVAGTKKNAINKYIMSYLVDSIYSYPDAGSNKTIDNMINLYFSDYRDIVEETAGTDYPALPWGLEINGSVLAINDLYISYSIDYYIFTGGAHPNGYTRFFNFNPSTGELINTGDIFKYGFEKKINLLLERKFREEFDLPSSAPLTDILFENKIEYNNNFSFGDNGITFLYNRYEIAPYVFGEIILEIPYSEINDILKESYQK